LLGPRKLDQGTDKAPSAETIGLNFAKENGIDGDGPQALAALRALPTERIVGGLSMQTLAGPMTFAGPMTDGRLVVGDPDEIYRSGKQQKVPVMIGVNSGDIGRSSAASLGELFASFGADRDAARAAYDPGHEEKLAQIGHDVAADRGMAEPARLTAQLISDQGLPAYEYRFSYVSPATRAALEKSPFKNVSATDGAKHGSELPFVFDTVSQMLPGASAADEATARAMNAYWTNFAKTGNPDSASLPHWPRYRRSEDVLMDFTPDGPKAGPDPWRARLDLTEKYAEH
jgi:para-nitrobenzyl esterase